MEAEEGKGLRAEVKSERAGRSGIYGTMIFYSV